MLNFFEWFLGRSKVGRTATELYGSIVTQARQPVFYTAYRVPDVAEKRYEMIVLHIVLVLERLRASDPDGGELGRELVEAFVSDLDGSIRELAVGDPKVPAKVRAAAAGLFDRDHLYRQAFGVQAGGEATPDDTTLVALINDLMFDDSAGNEALALARYVQASRAELATWSPDAAVDTLRFAQPDSVS